MRGKCPAADVIPYWLAQIGAAACAAGVVLFVLPPTGAGGGPPAPDIVKSLLVEFLYTFALCYVVLNVATADETAGNSFYGLAIGFTVLVGAYSVGAISGGAFNPAVGVGIAVMGLAPMTSIWIYFVSNLAGGACAALAFKAVHEGKE
jgi:aquaporin Z